MDGISTTSFVLKEVSYLSYIDSMAVKCLVYTQRIKLSLYLTNGVAHYKIFT